MVGARAMAENKSDVVLSFFLELNILEGTPLFRRISGQSLPLSSPLDKAMVVILKMENAALLRAQTQSQWLRNPYIYRLEDPMFHLKRYNRVCLCHQ